MILDGIAGALAAGSFLSTLWQWRAATRFPLHQPASPPVRHPPVTLLKPLKGADAFTEANLRSWLEQDYPGQVQVLFGVADPDDPAVALVNTLLEAFPHRDAKLVVCPERAGANAKVSQLIQLQPHAQHELLVVSDADVRAPPNLLRNLVAMLEPDPASGPQPQPVGLVTCFYRIAEPADATAATRWEAVAVNADFWSQVLQGLSFRPLDFALGAVMAVRRDALEDIGGFRALADYLADDFQLGRRIARTGRRIALCPITVECCSPPARWREVWRHQLRWARTIRVCQPGLYALSILGNATLWPLLWMGISLGTSAAPTGASAVTTAPGVALICGLWFWLTRVLTACDLQRRLTRRPVTPTNAWWVPLKDLLQVALWLCAFAGNRIEWRGEWYRVCPDGRLEPLARLKSMDAAPAALSNPPARHPAENS
ncbi:MAG: glycosyltransferase [Verrucomicrobiae bacterium]|nr:glycosyltransferase [Verrucomicrobiae bacterium]